MTYFHTGIRTIIGAEAFHCPVRDGKEWDHLAMVIRRNWLPAEPANLKSLNQIDSSPGIFCKVLEVQSATKL